MQNAYGGLSCDSNQANLSRLAIVFVPPPSTTLRLHWAGLDTGTAEQKVIIQQVSKIFIMHISVPIVYSGFHDIIEFCVNGPQFAATLGAGRRRPVVTFCT